MGAKAELSLCTYFLVGAWHLYGVPFDCEDRSAPSESSHSWRSRAMRGHFLVETDGDEAEHLMVLVRQ